MTASEPIYLIDDDEDVRRALAFLLTSSAYMVRVFHSASHFLESLPTLPPGCIVSDVRMPGIDGLELQKELRRCGSEMPVIIMTGHADVPLAVEAMKAGAIDFIEKPFSDETLLGAIERAFSLAERRGDTQKAIEAVTQKALLSEREQQVLDGLIKGLPNKTIAYDLGISTRTVEVHRAHVMSKMGASSLADLLRIVYRSS